jgi:type IV pilus assembly protein PilB
MVLSEEIDRMIIERYPSEDLRKAAIAEGMTPLREDGLLKVAQGVTTLEEIFRVVA